MAPMTAASIVGSAMPMQIIVDAQRNPTRTFQMKAPSSIRKQRCFPLIVFSGKFRLLPNERFMVVYANTADLQRKLTLPHPEKAKKPEHEFGAGR